MTERFRITPIELERIRIGIPSREGVERLIEEIDRLRGALAIEASMVQGLLRERAGLVQRQE